MPYEVIELFFLKQKENIIKIVNIDRAVKVIIVNILIGTRK